MQQIREANPAAAAQFLEHVVLQKRSTVRDAELLVVSHSRILCAIIIGPHFAHATGNNLCRPTIGSPNGRVGLETMEG